MPMSDDERDQKIMEIHKALYVGNGKKPIMSRLERLELIAAIVSFVAGTACFGVVAIVIERALAG